MIANWRFCDGKELYQKEKGENRTKLQRIQKIDKEVAISKFKLKLLSLME